MATIKFYNNCFEDEFKEVDFDKTKTLEQQIVENIDEDEYKKYLVECYDPETDKTFYAPILDNNDDTSVVIMANDKIVNMDYQPQNNDVVTVVFMPLSENFGIKGFWGGLIGSVVGSLAGLGIGFYVGGPAGMVVGAIIGGIIGLVLGVGVGHLIAANSKEQKYITKDIDSSLPDVRGAENQSLLNNPYPFVIGKQTISPFVVGDPITYYSTDGKNAYIKILYCAGYAPLRLTNLKLGDFLLTRNDTNSLMNGLVSNDAIQNRWKNNEITIDIIQQNPNDAVRRGYIYPDKMVQDEINANTFFIVDDKLKEQAGVVYKGVNFPSRFRTNGIWFTDSYPSEFTVTLNAPNGLYASYTKTTSDNDTSTSEQKYASINLCFAIQWRFYNKNNNSSDSEGSDWDKWENITYWNGAEYGVTYNRDLCIEDIEGHKGNSITYNKGNPFEVTGWKDATVCNFKSLSGENGTGQIRLSTTITLSEYSKQQMMTVDNTIHGIEIRVVRVSPNYLNETTSSSESEESAYSYSDLIMVDSITTKCFDADYYRRTNIFRNVPVQSDELMRQNVYIAINAKADVSGNILNQLKKFSCTAESFSPVLTNLSYRWSPSDVKRVTEYYGYYTDSTQTIKCNRTATAYEVDLGSDDTAKSKYETARQEGYSWYAENKGSNFTDLMKYIIFPSDEVSRKFYHIPIITGTVDLNYYQDILPIQATTYLNTTAASSFMLACVGNHNGGYALGYENINLLSVADCWFAQQNVEDGSTYTFNDGTHKVGEKISVKFEANGYVYNSIKLEDLLSKIAIAGRCAYTYDNAGRIMLIMDKPIDYAVGVINQQNIISSSQTYSYEQLPAGLLISFKDENDGYEQNNIYCWSDGNSIDKYKGNIEDYSFDFVTNNYQAWSLGRYLLGCRELNREIITAKIGAEGTDWKLGDVVVFQNEDLFIGDGSGRVQEVIKNDKYIYGFVMDSTYQFTGDTETVKIDDTDKVISKQGVEIFNPSESKSYTFRLALSNYSIVIDDTTYILQKGVTNLVLFAEPISLEKSVIRINQKDIVMFGIYDEISAKYRIIKKKPEKDFSYTLTLLQYNEQLYQYGTALPIFQSHITYKQPKEEGVSLSEIPTTIKDLSNNTISKINLTTKASFDTQEKNLKEALEKLSNGESTVPQNPSSVTELTATVEEGKILVNWQFTGEGLNNTVDVFKIELSKDEGNSWEDLISVRDNNYEYNFYTYLTSETLQKYRFRITVLNVYGNASESVVSDEPDLTNYIAKWQIKDIVVSAIAYKDIIDITINDSANTDQYGTRTFNLKVAKIKGIDYSSRIGGSGTKWYFDISGLYLEKDEVKALQFSFTVTNKAGESNPYTFSPSVCSDYKGWTPTAVSILNFKTNPDGQGLTISWDDTSTCWGELEYKVNVSYLDVVREIIVTKLKNITYIFDRDLDGFLEASQIIGNYSASVTVVNKESLVEKISDVKILDDTSRYRTWILSQPTLSAKVSSNEDYDDKILINLVPAVESIYGLKEYTLSVVNSGIKTVGQPVQKTENTWELDISGLNFYVDKNNPENDDFVKLTFICLVKGYIEDATKSDGKRYTGQEITVNLEGTNIDTSEYYNYETEKPVLVISMAGRTASLSFSHKKFAGFTGYQYQISDNGITWYSFGSNDTTKKNETAWKGIENETTNVIGSFATCILPLKGETTSQPESTVYYFRARTVGGCNSEITITSDWSDTVEAIATASEAMDLAVNAVTKAQIENNAVSTDKIASGSIYGDKIAGGTLSSLGATLGQVQTGIISSTGKEDTLQIETSDGTKEYKTTICDRDNSNIYINATAGNEEFYIGNVGCSKFNIDDKNHQGLHFYNENVLKDDENKEASPLNYIYNFVIKIAKFIVTSVSTIIKGVFVVSDDEDTSKRLLIANPDDKNLTKDGESSFGEDVPANTVKINGNLLTNGTITTDKISISNETNLEGSLNVRGETILYENTDYPMKLIDGGWWAYCTQIDLTDLTQYSEEAYYPIVIDLGLDTFNRIRVSRPLKVDYGVPSYSTHSDGFFACMEIETIGYSSDLSMSSQGTLRYVINEFFKTNDVTPIYYKQKEKSLEGSSTQGVFYLRGGSKYDVQTSRQTLVSLDIEQATSENLENQPERIGGNNNTYIYNNVNISKGINGRKSNANLNIEGDAQIQGNTTITGDTTIGTETNQSVVKVNGSVKANEFATDFSSIKKLFVPNLSEFTYYVIPFGKVPAPDSTENSPYIWDRECTLRFVRNSGHVVYSLHARAGHGYAHTFCTYCQLEQTDTKENFAWKWVTYKVSNEYYLALFGCLEHNAYYGYAEIKLEFNQSGLTTLELIPVYESFTGTVYRSDIRETLADVPDTWRKTSKINQGARFYGRVYAGNNVYPVGTMSTGTDGYWGFCDPDGESKTFIRTSYYGFIPYTNGTAGSGNGSLGTSTWFFKNAYIDKINGGEYVSAPTVIALSSLRIPIGHSSSTYTDGEIWIN